MDMKNLEKAIAYESSKRGVIKKCPHCSKEIQYEAIKCKNCGEMLSQRTDSVDTSERLKRNMFLRIIISILWFIPVFILTNMIVGGIVGAIAGGSKSGYQEGYSVGYVAGVSFREKYSLMVFFFQIVLTAALSIKGILPGTEKFKKNNSNQVRTSKLPKSKPNEMFKNLKWYEIIVACWPIVLITVGGAIGGAFGGLACALNFKIFNAKLSKPLKYIYSLLIGVGGILLYLVVVTVLVAIFPNIFNKK